MGRLINLTKNAYSSAKISVKQGELYGKDKILELSKLEFDEILRYLQEHGFRKSVDKAYLQYEGFYLIERVLNDHISQIYSSVFVGASKKNRDLLEAYYLKYQVHNMMVVIRCRVSKEEDFEAYLIGDRRRREKYVKAWEMPNIEDALIYMSKKLKFDEDKVLDLYNQSIYELENYLYKVYYERLKSISFKYNNIDEKVFSKFIRDYVDLLNARTYIKLKVENSKEINFEEFYIEGGRLQSVDFNNLNSKSIDDTMNYFKNFFGEVELNLESSSIDSLDKGVSTHKKRAEGIFKKAKFGSPFYALRYLFKAEREINTLRTLLKAKHLKMSQEEISNLIS